MWSNFLKLILSPVFKCSSTSRRHAEGTVEEGTGCALKPFHPCATCRWRAGITRDVVFHAAAEHATDTCVNSCWQAGKNPEAAPAALQPAVTQPTVSRFLRTHPPDIMERAQSSRRMRSRNVWVVLGVLAASFSFELFRALSPRVSRLRSLCA